MNLLERIKPEYKTKLDELEYLHIKDAIIQSLTRESFISELKLGEAYNVVYYLYSTEESVGVIFNVFHGVAELNELLNDI